MNPTEHTPKTPRVTTGLFAMLGARLRLQGTRAPKITRIRPSRYGAGLSLALLLLLSALALTAAPAFAAEEPPEIGLTSLAPTEVTYIGVVNPHGSVEAGEYWFVYRPSSKAEDKCQGAGEQRTPKKTIESQLFFETIAGLTPGTGYAICLVVENAAKETAMSPSEFFETPLPPIPPETPVAELANPVTSGEATLNGVLNPAAARESEPGAAEFRYRRSATECEGENEKSAPAAETLAGKQDEAVKAAVTGLLPNTTYTFCVRATNNHGEEALSTPVSFTTPAAPPSFSEVSTTNVTSTSAILHATVDPGGLETSYAFQYAPAGSTEFKPVPEPKGHGSGTLPAGGTGVPVEVHLDEGLTPSTAYEFRVVSSHAGKEEQTSEQVWFRTQGAGSFALADNRDWELVTPPDKHGAFIETLGGCGSGCSHLTASSPQGTAFTYAATAPMQASPSGYAGAGAAVQVLSTRTNSGWSSTELTAPHANQQTGDASTHEYPLFSEDLSHATLHPFGAFLPTLSPEASEQTPYLRTNYTIGPAGEFVPCTSSCYWPLVTGKEPYANVLPGTIFGLNSEGFPKACPPTSECGPLLVSATPDLSHVVLKSNTPFEPGVPGEALYEWSAATGHLLPISVLPNGETSGGEVFLGGALGTEARHAISNDGSRALFTTGDEGNTRLYLRDMLRGETVELGGEGAFFQVASSDGSKIFYTTGQQAGDLYEFEVTSGPNEPLAGRETPLTSGANVQDNVIGASEDGSYVYFVANAQLAPGAVAGTCSTSHLLEQQGQCNLYEWHEGRITLVAVLGANDWPDWTGEGITGGGLASLSARVSPDGQWLAFMSQRPLTGYNSDDAKTGRPDEEVFLYDATRAGLVCASCDPTGARPVGVEWKDMIPGIDGQEPGWHRPEGLGLAPQGLAGSVPGWQTPFIGDQATYQSRYLSDSGRLFFNATDALVPADINGVTDVYEYEPQGVPEGEHACSSASTSGSDVFKPERTVKVEVGTPQEHAVTEGAGCVALISSGTSPEESAFLDASAGAGEGEHGQPGSEGGADVFFLTAEKLAPQDFDNAYDVYDAHECTSAEPCLPQAAETPPACTTTDSCRPAATPQPEVFGAPPSATFSGPGNLAPPPPAVVKPKPKPTKCKKGFTKNKKGKCIKNKKKKKAGNKRGAKR